MKKGQVLTLFALGLLSLGSLSPVLADEQSDLDVVNSVLPSMQIGNTGVDLNDVLYGSADSAKSSGGSSKTSKKDNKDEGKHSMKDKIKESTSDKKTESQDKTVGPVPERDNPSESSSESSETAESTDSSESSNSSADNIGKISDSDIEKLAKLSENASDSGQEKHNTNLNISYADMADSMDKLSQFGSKTYFKDGVFSLKAETNYLINSMVTIPFWLTKMIFLICANVYSFVQSGNTTNLDTYLNQVIERSVSVFNAILSPSVMTFVGGVIVAYAFFRAIRGGSFFGTLFRSLAIYIAVLLFYTNINGSYAVSKIYSASGDLTTEMTSNMLQSTQAYASDDAVLDMYFRTAIWKPYVYMNTDVKEMKEDGTFTSNDESVTTDIMKELLDYKSGDKEFTLNNGKKMADFVGEGKNTKVPRMTDAWGVKFLYALGSMFEALGMGVLIILIAVISFILKIVFFLLIILSPFILLIGLFPPFENTFFNFMKTTFGVVILSEAINFLTVFVLFFYTVLTGLTEAMFSDYFVATFFKFFVLVVLWWKRSWFASLIQLDSAQSFMNGFGGRIQNLGLRRLNRRLRRRDNTFGRRLTNKGLSKLNTGRKMVTGAMKHTASKMAKKGYRDLDNRYLDAKGKVLSRKHGWSEDTGKEVARYRRRNMTERLTRAKESIGRVRDRALGSTLAYAGAGMTGESRDRVLSKAKTYQRRTQAVTKPTRKPSPVSKDSKGSTTNKVGRPIKPISQKELNQVTKKRLEKQRQKRQQTESTGFKQYSRRERQVRLKTRKRG